MKQCKKYHSPQPLSECCCEGPPGLPGLPGPEGPEGPDNGPVGSQGFQGVQGVEGVAGPIGLQGPTGVQGPQGFQGAAGNKGPPGDKGGRGIIGDRGSEGPPGPPGPTNNPQLPPRGILDYMEYYKLNPNFLIPPVPTPPVAAGQPVDFDSRVFPFSVGDRIRRAGLSFSISPGVYRISWQATIVTGRLELWVGPSLNSQTAITSTTISGDASPGAYQLSNTVLYEATTAQNEWYISIRNPLGSNPIQFEPRAGGDGGGSRVSTSIVIQCIAPPRS
jgi:hypothetical protein